jgi:hypothetical protein
MSGKVASWLSGLLAHGCFSCFSLVGVHTFKFSVLLLKLGFQLSFSKVVEIFCFGSQAGKHLSDVRVLLVTQAEGK